LRDRCSVCGLLPAGSFIGCYAAIAISKDAATLSSCTLLTSSHCLTRRAARWRHNASSAAWFASTAVSLTIVCRLLAGVIYHLAAHLRAPAAAFRACGICHPRCLHDGDVPPFWQPAGLPARANQLVSVDGSRSLPAATAQQRDAPDIPFTTYFQIELRRWRGVYTDAMVVYGVPRMRAADILLLIKTMTTRLCAGTAGAHSTSPAARQHRFAEPPLPAPTLLSQALQHVVLYCLNSNVGHANTRCAAAYAPDYATFLPRVALGLHHLRQLTHYFYWSWRCYSLLATL